MLILLLPNNGPSIPEFRIVWETKLDESFLRREPDESGAGTNQSEFGLYVDSSIYEDQFMRDTKLSMASDC